MADITAPVFPYQYTEAEVAPVDNRLILPSTVNYNKLDYRAFSVPKIFKITVTVGTFQFAVNGNPVATSPSVTVAGTIEISLNEEDRIYFKGTAQNDSFYIHG